MYFNLKATVAAVAITATAVIAATPANARWRGHHYHHHGYYGGGAALGGFAAGAILGSALAAQRPYYYAPGPVYGGDADAYCFSRFKSYDPASGTYLGYDGYRHPCP
jgi:hypothetical protein